MFAVKLNRSQELGLNVDSNRDSLTLAGDLILGSSMLFASSNRSGETNVEFNLIIDGILDFSTHIDQFWIYLGFEFNLELFAAWFLLLDSMIIKGSLSGQRFDQGLLVIHFSGDICDQMGFNLLFLRCVSMVSTPDR